MKPLLVLGCLVLASCQLEDDVDDDRLASSDAPACVAPKIAICHIPPGNPDNAHTICVSDNARRAHLAHGDDLGACEPGCDAPAPEVCGDGVDDDCDGTADDGCIGDRAWQDAPDSDGAQDVDEVGLPDTTFILRTAGGAVVQTVVTDATGTYFFTEVPAGDYTIEVIPPPGFQVTLQDATSDDLDSDFDPLTFSTGVFTFDGGATVDLDAGLFLTPF